jgi:hypothetical protein
MKRTAILLSMLVLLSLALVSCDAMFSTNIFSKATHPTPSAADMTNKTPVEMQAYVASAANLEQLAQDPALKAAALDALGYGAADPPPPPATTPDDQIAAIVAADIAIRTVPVAAQFSAGILGYLVGGGSVPTDASGNTTLAGVTTLVDAILPQDIQDGIASGGAMPQSFLDMIGAFAGANDAYNALGLGIGTTGYAEGTGLSSSDKSDIAVNAVISGLISAIEPLNAAVPGSPTPAEIADALWSALIDPASAGSVISIDPAAFTTLTDTTGTGAVANLLAASGLASLMGGN